MSEYRYYEFAAVDRPLDRDEMADVRALSTWAHITPTSFVNEYQWGDFRGDSLQLVERYYDAFLYVANWGTRQLMLRFPAALLDPSVAERYCVGDAVSAYLSSKFVIVSVVSEDDEGDFEWGGEGVLSSVLPVRAEILAGDLRALYLMWLLVGLLRGDEPHLRAMTLRGMGGPAAEAGPRRMAGQLLEDAAARLDVRNRALEERRERAAAESKRRAVEARRERLDKLIAEGERAGERVAMRIAGLKEEHRRKPALLPRLAAAGL